MRAAPLLALTLLPLASGADCVPTTSDPEVDTGDTAAGRWYVDNDDCLAGGCVFSLWIYLEANALEGLQRRDGGHDDTCGGAIAPDGLQGF